MTYPKVGPFRTHGTISCYNAGCHCPDCRRAAREHRSRYRRRSQGTGQRRSVERACPKCGQWFRNLGNHERTCNA